MDDGPAHTPMLWWFEVRNALLVAERRGRLAETAVSRFLGILAGMDITVAVPDDDAVAFRLVRRHRLSFYDASYLALAVRLGCPLATLDVPLSRAAQAEGLPSLA